MSSRASREGCIQVGCFDTLPEHGGQTNPCAEYAAPGCEAVEFLKCYNASKDKQRAIDEALVASFGKQACRYAEGGIFYTASQFKDFFGHSWLAKWMASPVAKKVAEDGKAYSASQFHTGCPSGMQQLGQRKGALRRMARSTPWTSLRSTTSPSGSRSGPRHQWYSAAGATPEMLRSQESQEPVENTYRG